MAIRDLSNIKRNCNKTKKRDIDINSFQDLRKSNLRSSGKTLYKRAKLKVF
jgi:hypothetical protein